MTDVARHILDLFHQEFGFLAHRFAVFNLSLPEVMPSDDEFIWHPGVYVFWRPGKGVIKVGRSLSNSRKRAFAHIRDNTGQDMGNLEGGNDARLFLFNLKKPEDRHRACTLEVYFEEELDPEIRSGRQG